MTRTLRITYSLSFLGLLVGMGVWSTGGLQSFQRTEQMTLLNGKLAKAAETHYDKHFPIKRLGTNLWAAMDFKLFNEGRPGVVLGRDQWLFSDEEFKPTAGAEQLMAENLALIRGVRDTLQQHGSQLVLAIVPAKARVYAEYLGKELPTSLHGDLYNQFHAQARQANDGTAGAGQGPWPGVPAHRHPLDADGGRSGGPGTGRSGQPAKPAQR